MTDFYFTIPSHIYKEYIPYCQGDIYLDSRKSINIHPDLKLVFTNYIDKKHYPYVVWIMATALIFHVSLFTNYIPVQDVYMEYYMANTVINNHIWNYNMTDTYNTVLSDTLLPSFIIMSSSLKLMSSRWQKYFT